MDLADDLAPTGTLRASINLGNPVLAQGTAEDPGGVTVDLARDLAARLGVPLELVCFSAAKDSLAALQEDRADVCFLAVDPARAATVAFTAPYAVIEGVYAAREGSFATADEVDRPGVRIGVKQGSAYDLFLTRTLRHAEVVRGSEGTAVFAEQGLDVAAGIRQPVTDFAATRPGLRVLEPRFMEIQQAVGTTRARSEETVAFLRSFVEEHKADGFVAASLRRSGRTDAAVAPPAGT
jgi:polar amino acid transport system substrate-binding protein